MSNVRFYGSQKEETLLLRKKSELREIQFDYEHKKVIINGRTEALLAINFEYEEWNGCIMIEEFEVFEKGAGIGTFIIKELLNINKGKKFCLYSEPLAERFWKSVGFVKGVDGEGTDMYYF